MNKLHFASRMLCLLFLITLLTMCSKPVAKDQINLEYEKYVMPNGLQVVLHTDHSDPMVSYAIMYHTGSSREVPGKTGFAHLFEHLLFAGSENVPTGKFDMIMEGVGGSNNGFTNRDVTTYFEMFPANALEKVLWLESDRMGFFINSVTSRALAIQQNVVQNEKRQYEDNSPYGFTDYVISKNLYPDAHPYSWPVIGEMEDLKNATLDDVRSYYGNFYGPNNATLVLAGDFNPDTARMLINKYFGEIESHGVVPARTSMVPKVDHTVKLMHEDNFANVPELNIVWPVPQSYQKDSYALDFLAKILSDGKKAPLYKVLVKEKNLTARASAYNNAGELAGEFTISIRANEGKSLKEIEEAVNEAFILFEKEGMTEKDIERIKAASEKNFYEGLNSVYNKSIQLAFYNTFLNNPGYFMEDINNIRSVTIEDVRSVYDRYIKGKPRIITSFVPKGRPEMAAENSVPATVKEESITEASQVEIAGNAADEIVKTPSLIDRSVEPQLSGDLKVSLPGIWKAELSNGIKVYGIESSELPLVSFSMSIDGGVYQDKTELPGVANMVAGLLPQGTKNKSPEDFEEEIELLGSTLRVSAGNEEISLNASALSRNFGKTMDLITELVLEPRWDSTEFGIALSRTKNMIIQAEAQPRSVASLAFFNLLYGKDHIFGYSSRGTRESIDKITIDDIRKYYENNFSPSLTRIHVAGNVTKEQVLEALKPLEAGWQPKEVVMNNYRVPEKPEKSQIYFVDIPGSRQSVIYIGYPAISRDNPDYIKTDFINYRLGGAFTSIFNQILREEKGFTYGASSYFGEQKVAAPFVASTSVRSDATFESVRIFKEEMEKYRNGISENELQFIKNSMIRSNALRFETNGALVSMLSTMSKFGLPDDYIMKEEEIIKGMTVEEHRRVTGKYINPDSMYYVVVGDAATQLKPLGEIGFGKPVQIMK